MGSRSNGAKQRMLGVGPKPMEPSRGNPNSRVRVPLPRILAAPIDKNTTITKLQEERLNMVYDLYIAGVPPRSWRKALKDAGQSWSNQAVSQVFDKFWSFWLTVKADECFPGNRQHALAAAIERGLHVYNVSMKKEDIGGMIAASKWVADLQGVGLRAQIWARKEKLERDRDLWKQAHADEKMKVLQSMDTKQLKAKVMELLEDHNKGPDNGLDDVVRAEIVDLDNSEIAENENYSGVEEEWDANPPVEGGELVDEKKKPGRKKKGA